MFFLSELFYNIHLYIILEWTFALHCVLWTWACLLADEDFVIISMCLPDKISNGQFMFFFILSTWKLAVNCRIGRRRECEGAFFAFLETWCFCLRVYICHTVHWWKEGCQQSSKSPFNIATWKSVLVVASRLILIEACFSKSNFSCCC